MAQKGVCKWFNNKKGFGFITPSDGSTDVFVHYSSIQVEGYRSLREGQEVEFETTKSEKGLEARDVRVVVQ